ncbi:MAG: WhiB family transcriptional regulator [Microthrixaceae bacterium]
MQSWQRRASCAGLDSAIFYPPSDDEASRAKAVCAECPVRIDCLEFAVTVREKDGVWGGFTAIERQRLIRRRRRQRRAALASTG